MGYIEKNLTNNEEIIYRAKIHWFIFIPGLLFLLLSFYIYKNIDQLGKPNHPYYVFSIIVASIIIAKVFYHFMLSYNTNNKDIVQAGINNLRVFMILILYILSASTYLLILGKPEIKEDQVLVFILSIALYTQGISTLVNAFFYKIFTEMALTSKRVIYKTGFIKRDTIELNYNKIESLSFSQSIVGRIFNFGNIEIYGVGGVTSPIHDIDNPLEFKKIATELLDKTDINSI